MPCHTSSLWHWITWSQLSQWFLKFTLIYKCFGLKRVSGMNYAHKPRFYCIRNANEFLEIAKYLAYPNWGKTCHINICWVLLTVELLVLLTENLSFKNARRTQQRQQDDCFRMAIVTLQNETNPMKKYSTNSLPQQYGGYVQTLFYVFESFRGI